MSCIMYLYLCILMFLGVLSSNVSISVLSFAMFSGALLIPKSQNIKNQNIKLKSNFLIFWYFVVVVVVAIFPVGFVCGTLHCRKTSFCGVLRVLPTQDCQQKESGKTTIPSRTTPGRCHLFMDPEWYEPWLHSGSSHLCILLLQDWLRAKVWPHSKLIQTVTVQYDSMIRMPETICLTWTEQVQESWYKNYTLFLVSFRLLFVVG